MPKQEDVYRSCASAMVFRRANVCAPEGCDALLEILLLHKPRKRDAWQLPQGGVENGETVEDAALRELQEEAGMSAQLLGKSTHVYQYEFPASYRRFRPDNVCGQRVEYVFALVESDQAVQVDNEEIDDYVWVRPEQLGQYVKRKEYVGFLEKLFNEGRGLSIRGTREGREEGEEGF